MREEHALKCFPDAPRGDTVHHMCDKVFINGGEKGSKNQLILALSIVMVCDEAGVEPSTYPKMLTPFK